jgi:hypothetical protein
MCASTIASTPGVGEGVGEGEGVGLGDGDATASVALALGVGEPAEGLPHAASNTTATRQRRSTTV